MRQLAAIMFTDIVGYTSIMQNDESHGMRIRAKHREIFEAQHAASNGNIIQYFGDGTLSIFKSAVEAVSCAIDMQQNFIEGDMPIQVRIGIHLGDILYDGTEVFGDGVNVASRIESISTPGSVLVSDQLNRELKSHPHLKTISLGSFNFKNVLEPIEVFALNKDFLNIPDLRNLPNSLSVSDKSVAVLPFENISPSDEHEYLSDGMTEEIISALTKIKELKVTSRTSSFHFKSKNLDLKEIGELLKVSTLIVGSVRLAGNMMRVSTQLVDVSDDVSIWSEIFDRSLDNIFSVQDEISIRIADKLREHLGHFNIENHLINKPNVSVNGYTEYLKSRYLILKMNATDIDRGLAILKEVIKASPEYVYAYLGIHMGYVLKGSLGFMKSELAFSEGQKYLEKAIELDEDLPECQLQQAWISIFQKWDLDAAYKHLEKVHDANPFVDYYQTMASIIVIERNYDAATNYINTALKLDPFSNITHHLKGFIHYLQGDFEEAISFYKKSIDLNPSAEVSYLELGQALILSNRIDDALNHFKNLPKETDQLLKIGGITLVNIILGKKAAADDGLSKLRDALDSPHLERALYFLILCETLRENFDQVITYVKQAISYRLPMLLFLKVDPILQPLYEVSGFTELLKDTPTKKSRVSSKTRTYKKALLKPTLLERYRKELSKLMNSEFPFLDPFLTLRDLSEQMGIPANHMSQLLNQGFDKNFSEFVNTYRLNHFIEHIRKPENEHFTLLAVAYESGFNSKTVFNNFFKKVMGTTPSEYLKSIRTQ
tara:strand:- start:1428 stop:3749 length:2322 start_codon:yes stop_codon:yes gene_type:complete